MNWNLLLFIKIGKGLSVYKSYSIIDAIVSIILKVIGAFDGGYVDLIENKYLIINPMTTAALWLIKNYDYAGFSKFYPKDSSKRLEVLTRWNYHLTVLVEGHAYLWAEWR